MLEFAENAEMIDCDRPFRKPPRIANLETRCCLECATIFAQKRHDQNFCKQGCRRAWFARVDLRGRESYEAVMDMRRKKRGGLTRLTNLADRWLREDAPRDKKRAEAMGRMKGGQS